MEMQIIRINENSWRIEDAGVRFFLLTGTERALLVDSGRSGQNAKEIAESLTSLPLSLLNTHADGDHVAGNAQFSSFYMHPDEEENYRRGSRPGRILPVREGDAIELGGRQMEIIHLPGHTPGSIALLDVQNRVLISGDPIQDGRIFQFGRFRNMENFIASLAHLQDWNGQFDEVWPSHASFPVSPSLIPLLHDGAEAVMRGEIRFCREEVFGTAIRAYDIGCATFLCDDPPSWEKLP